MIRFRIGQGYDAHRFADDRPLILGGVRIEHSRGLLGHSDADVLVHSVIDALLGAAALGDIGKHFPDTDEKYRDISSLELLSQTWKMISDKGYRLSNIDVTLVLERPKISQYVKQMSQNIAYTLNISEDDVNIKATTEEKMGFTGRDEGACAYAVALIEKK